MNTSDFDKIVLTPEELNILRKLVDQKPIDQDLCKKYPQFYAIGFLKRKEIPGRIGTVPFGNYFVDERAKQYIRYVDSQRKLRMQNTRRYWITTAIALAALVKSFWPEITSIAEALLQRLMQ